MTKIKLRAKRRKKPGQPVIRSRLTESQERRKAAHNDPDAKHRYARFNT